MGVFFSFGFHSTYQGNTLQLILVATYLSDTTDYDTHLFCFTHGEFFTAGGMMVICIQQTVSSK